MNTSTENESPLDTNAALVDLDPTKAKEAFEELLAEIENIPDKEAKNPKTDCVQASQVAHGVGLYVNKPDVRTLFMSLPEVNGYKRVYVGKLPVAGLASWHAGLQFQNAKAGGKEPKLPASMVKEALTYKGRMMPMVEYNLGEHPVAGPIVKDIRLRTGYADLANDLQRLAGLCVDYKDDLSHDKKNYRAGDAEAAEKLAVSIITQLEAEQNENTKLWSKRSNQAFALLRKMYRQIRRGGHFIYFDDPRVDELFPSLHTAGRGLRRKR